MPHRTKIGQQYRRTKATLITIASTFWSADAVIAAVDWDDRLRSISQGIAVTATILAGVALMRDADREARRGWRSSVRDATRYVGRCTVDRGDVTTEIPTQRTRDGVPGMPAVVMGQLYRLGRAAAGRPGRRSM